MPSWFIKGVTSPIKTTHFPHQPNSAAGASPGRPLVTEFASHAQAEQMAAECPTGAIHAGNADAEVNLNRCIHCMRCARSNPSMEWKTDYNWARRLRTDNLMPQPFRKSLHIRLVDTGACDAVIQEIKQLTKPYYNMHKLGFFITPTPRHADVLMVTGPLTHHMHLALQKTYEAMPNPKWIIAVGGCALGGCVFHRGFTSSGGVLDSLPVDVEVPGCPPPPMAILYGLMLLAGRVGEITYPPKALEKKS
jgi:Ni,Fe-hydrogenase III small subunit/uncharacterized Fe-S cluster protein YjdI